MRRNEVKNTYRKITLDMILGATSLIRPRSETNEAFLERVTHLHLQGKKLRLVEKLEQCTNLKVLYLYDNQISVIENLGFAEILQYLYLQNNVIKEIPLLPMTNLMKIYLDENDIQCITGLQNCCKLEELHVGKQRLPPFTSLEFDPISLDAIGKTLQVLDISGNGIRSLIPFCKLYHLRKFLCSDNQVADLTHVEEMVAMPQMEEANFKGNPCCKVHRYRDHVIGSSSDALSTLDELIIHRHQHIAIRGLQSHRRKLGLSMDMSRPDEDMEYGDAQGENLATYSFHQGEGIEGSDGDLDPFPDQYANGGGGGSITAGSEQSRDNLP